MILAYFKTFFKKNKENSKVTCWKENDNQILLKMRFWYLKKMKGEKVEESGLFEKMNCRKYLQNKTWGQLF